MSKFQQAVAALFSENLARARKHAGLSQEEVGYRASLHRTEISLLERGTRIPQLDTILKLAGGLSISPCELLPDIAWVPGATEPGRFELIDRKDREVRSDPDPGSD